jgi:uncharacterized protein (TIGR02466 family)
MVEFFFPTPIYYYVFEPDVISLIDCEIAEYESTIDKQKLINPWGDTVLTNFRYAPYNHSLNSLPNLKNKIIECSSQYLDQLSINYKSIDISESWINYSANGGMQNFHLHDGYDISGVYFYRTNAKDGDLVFINPSLVNRFHKITSSNFSKISYRPEIGKLIIFPSFLEHSVNINTTDSLRISISFNARIN